MTHKIGFSSCVSNSRPRNLSPISPTPTPTTRSHNRLNGEFDEQSRSATITTLKKLIKQLNEENKTLKDEITEQREAIKQIFNESRHEKYDERRINMLKFQIIQLERQISILTESLGARSQSVMEVENCLTVIGDRLRSYISAEVKGQMVPVARSDLMNLVDMCESSRIKLYKSIEKQSSKDLGKTLLYLNPCLRDNGQQGGPVSLLDISKNRLDYINLQYVSQLESKLSVLYKDLIYIHTQIETIVAGGGANSGSGCGLMSGHTPSSQQDRLETSLLKAGVSIKDCTDDLLALSLLCPSAPCPILNRPVVKDIPVDRIISALPPLSPNKLQEVHHLVKTCVLTLTHRLHLMHKEKAVMEEELAFHRAVYKTHAQYTHSVFKAIREGCQQYEHSVQTLLCDPLKSILSAYSRLEGTKSKEALREILLVLKAHESQFESIVEMFEDPSSDTSITRSEALSNFSSDLMQHVDGLVASCQRKRDQAVMDKKEVKDKLKSMNAELMECIQDLEVKYDKQWLPYNQHSSVSQVCEENSLVSDCKSFIHSQLFEEAGGDDSNTRSNGKKGRDGDKMKDDDRDDINGRDLKLRSYLDDDDNDKYDNDGSVGNSKPKRVTHKSKWVSDFTTDPPKPETGDKPSTPAPSSTSRKKPWKPDKDWIQDFTNGDSDDTINPDHSSQISLLSKQACPPSTTTTTTNPKPISSRKSTSRTYPVDLRVANPKLQLKRPDR